MREEKREEQEKQKKKTFLLQSEIKVYFHHAAYNVRVPEAYGFRSISVILRLSQDTIACQVVSVDFMETRIRHGCISAEQQTTDGRRASASDRRVSALLYNGDVQETGACPREPSPIASAAFSITLQPAEHVNVHNFSNDAQDVRIRTGR